MTGTRRAPLTDKAEKLLETLRRDGKARVVSAKGNVDDPDKPKGRDKAPDEGAMRTLAEAGRAWFELDSERLASGGFVRTFTVHPLDQTSPLVIDLTHGRGYPIELTFEGRTVGYMSLYSDITKDGEQTMTFVVAGHSEETWDDATSSPVRRFASIWRTATARLHLDDRRSERAVTALSTGYTGGNDHA